MLHFRCYCTVQLQYFRYDQQREIHIDFSCISHLSEFQIGGKAQTQWSPTLQCKSTMSCVHHACQADVESGCHYTHPHYAAPSRMAWNISGGMDLTELCPQRVVGVRFSQHVHALRGVLLQEDLDRRLAVGHHRWHPCQVVSEDGREQSWKKPACRKLPGYYRHAAYAHHAYVLTL